MPAAAGEDPVVTALTWAASAAVWAVPAVIVVAVLFAMVVNPTVGATRARAWLAGVRYRNNPTAQAWLAAGWPQPLLKHVAREDRVTPDQWAQFAAAAGEFLSADEAARCQELGITPAHLSRVDRRYLPALLDAARHGIPLDLAVEALATRDLDALEDLGVALALAKALPGWFPGVAACGDGARWVQSPRMLPDLSEDWMLLRGGQNIDLLRPVLAPLYAALGADASWFAAAGFTRQEAEAAVAAGTVDRDVLATLAALSTAR